MSQIETRNNAVSIDTIAGLCSTVIATSVVISEVIKNVQELHHRTVTSSEKIIISDRNVIESPVIAFEKFEKIYKENLIQSESLQIDEKKHKVLESIAHVPFRIKDIFNIEKSMEKFHNSDIFNFEKNSKALINEIRAQHSEVFVEELSRVVSEASHDAGYKSVSIKMNESNPVIIALDKEGKGIVSEIKTDKKNMNIDLISETIGITDGSCSSIMNKFGNSLKKYGVKFTSVENKYTGGVCMNPVSKKIEERISSKKDKDKILIRLRNNSKNTKLINRK